MILTDRGDDLVRFQNNARVAAHLHHFGVGHKGLDPCHGFRLAKIIDPGLILIGHCGDKFQAVLVHMRLQIIHQL